MSSDASLLPVNHLQGDPQHQLDQDVEGHVEEAGVDEAVAYIAPGLDSPEQGKNSQEQLYVTLSPAWIVN